MRPTTFADVVFAFVLGFLSAGPDLALPTLPGISWILPASAPISDPGFRVLLTYPESNRGNLPPGQKQIYDSTAIPAYLDAHCVKDAKNAPEWRLWPDTETPKEDQPIWQKLMKLANGKGAMVIISDGRRGTIQPWPADEAAMLALLKKYGG